MQQNTRQRPPAVVPDDKSRLLRLDVGRIEKVFSLLGDVDSVELKLTVPDSDRASTISALDVDPLDAQLRQVVFFDTPDLRLDRAGVVVRARRIPDGGDVVVKLRPIEPADLPGKLRHSRGFTIEVDAMPGTFVCSGSLKSAVDNSDVKKVLAGKRPIHKLFEPGLRAFYEEHAPKGLDLDSLTALGPITVAKLKLSHPELRKHSIVAEQWLYPDGSRVLELSTKCAPDKAFEALKHTRTFLLQRGISLTGEQHTKTRKALEYFARLHSEGRKSARKAS